MQVKSSAVSRNLIRIIIPVYIIGWRTVRRSRKGYQDVDALPLTA